MEIELNNLFAMLAAWQEKHRWDSTGSIVAYFDNMSQTHVGYAITWSIARATTA